MSRPRKCRRICHLPSVTSFGPQQENNSQIVIMGMDEYETIRLLDLQQMTQEEAASCMNVARATVQAVYNQARKKIADCLINGKCLRIEGGEIELCNGRSNCPNSFRCPKCAKQEYTEHEKK